MNPTEQSVADFFAKELTRILVSSTADDTLQAEERVFRDLLNLERDAEQQRAPEWVIWSIAQYRRDAGRACLQVERSPSKH